MVNNEFKITHFVREATDRDQYCGALIGTNYNIAGTNYTITAIESYAKAILEKGDKIELYLTVGPNAVPPPEKEDIKYYTPDISEFHVGFEFERFYNYYESEDSEAFNMWIKYEFNPNILSVCFKDLETLDQEIHSDKIRVKFLDKEDIEDLGFEYGEYSKLQYEGLIVDLFNKVENIYQIWVTGDMYKDKVFEGRIKNKSELKKLLTQLGIEFDNK